MRASSIQPTARALATLAAGIGTLLVRDPLALAAFWLAIILPLLVGGGVGRAHLRFLVWVVVPVAAALFVVWGGIVGAAPGTLPGSAPTEGVRFAATTSLRLTVLGSLWQLCFLTLSPEELGGTLRSWGFRGEALVVILGSLAVLPELLARGRQVLTARYARGFVSRGDWWSRARQFPPILPPLVAWVLRASIQRDETWRHRGLLERFGDAESSAPIPWSGTSAGLLVIALTWFAFGIWSRVN